MKLSEDTVGNDHVGATAHWLAAEYVVLEGWKQLDHSDHKLDKLLSLYPENVKALQRCRNAVYHFQAEVLDQRILRCIANENEVMIWSIALHFEFQRYLLNFPYSFSGSHREQEELADEMEKCVGWWPTDTGSAGVRRIYNKCMNLASIASAEDSCSALARSTIQKLAELDAESFTSKLSRWKASDA